MRDWSVVCGLTVLIFKPQLQAVTLYGEANLQLILNLGRNYRKLGSGEYRLEPTSLIGGTCYSAIIVIVKTIKLYFVIK